MNRAEFMDLATVTCLGSKKCNYNVEQAHIMSGRLMGKIVEVGLFGEGAPAHAELAIKAAIAAMFADCHYFGNEDHAIKKAFELVAFRLNPKAAMQKQNAANASSVADKIHNPDNLPVFLPGGQLEISGVPPMNQWPSSSAVPTEGVLSDATLTPVGTNP